MMRDIRKIIIYLFCSLEYMNMYIEQLRTHIVMRQQHSKLLYQQRLSIC